MLFVIQIMFHEERMSVLPPSDSLSVSSNNWVFSKNEENQLASMIPAEVLQNSKLGYKSI